MTTREADHLATNMANKRPNKGRQRQKWNISEFSVKRVDFSVTSDFFVAYVYSFLHGVPMKGFNFSVVKGKHPLVYNDYYQKN